ALVDARNGTLARLAERVNAAWSERMELRAGLFEILRTRWGSDPKREEQGFELLNSLSDRLAIRAADDDLRAELGVRFAKWIANRKAPASRWVPLSANATKLLRKIAPEMRIGRYMTLGAGEIANRIAAHQLAVSTIADEDLEKLRNTWTPEERSELARSGRF